MTTSSRNSESPAAGSFITGLKDLLFGNVRAYKLPLGEVLIERGLIKRHQLEKALEMQKNFQGREGRTPCLGEILVSEKLVTEQQLLQAINEHYRLAVSSLSADIESFINEKRRTFTERLLMIRMPIWFKLSVATTMIIIAAIAGISFMILERQKNELYLQTVKIGTVSLNYFANDARIPLLEDNILRLNTLLNEATSVEGIRYAFIVDKKNNIKAHTDHNKINTPYQKIKGISEVAKEGDTVYFNYNDAATGEKLLNLTKPVRFQDVKLGEVNVGISLDFIDNTIKKARLSIVAITSLVVFLGIGTTILLGFGFSRPILKLVMATEELGKGHYNYKVYLTGNDELRDLAIAFNNMSHELRLKELMQESFGKYVGSEVLEMILANPESSWVKGHRNEATILFTDIRDFTAYSESRDPEEIVEILNTYFEISGQAIQERGGYIDKFIGDAVLGVFGVPVEKEDHVTNAVLAAVDIQRKLQAASRKMGDELLARVGIGINSGVVVAGNIGSHHKMEYTVIGDSVNVASRINNLAGPGEIIIHAGVYEHVKELVTAEELPPRNIKGKAEPVITYRITSLKGEAS